MRLIDADRLLDRCKFYHLPNGDLAVPIIDVQHAPTVEAPDINVGNMDVISKWKADFKGYINDLNMPKDDYDGIMEYIDEVPSAQPETTKRIVGKSRDGMTLWYQCDTCNEPVDAQDNYCRGCGRRLIDEAD